MQKDSIQALFVLIENLIERGVKDKRYSQDSAQSVDFEQGYEFKLVNGTLDKLPTSMKLSKRLYWSIQTQKMVLEDLKASSTSAELLDFINNNVALIMDLSAAFLESDVNRISSIKDIFLRKYSGGELRCSSLTGIRGVGLEIPSFSFGVDDIQISFSQPSLEDLRLAAAAGELFSASRFPTLKSKITVPITNESFARLRDETEILIWILSLFGVGTVAAETSDYEFEDSSIFHKSSTGREVQSTSISFYYCLTVKKLEVLQKAYPILRKSMIDAGFVDGKLNASQVAFERYRDGLKYTSTQKQVSSAVMGLEAIFTEKGPEVSYSLRMRIATLCRVLGKVDPRKVIKHAYDIRSDYAHGNTNTEKLEEKSLTIIPERGKFSGAVLDILRLSLLCVLCSEFDQPKGHVKKFQSALDDMMVMQSKDILHFVKKYADILIQR